MFCIGVVDKQRSPCQYIFVAGSNTTMLLLSTAILLCMSPQAKASVYCANESIAWTGNEVKAIDDCDILKDEVIVHFDRLAERRNCLKHVKVQMEFFPDQKRTVSMGRPISGNEKTAKFINPLSKEERCKSISIYFSTWVFSGAGQNTKYWTSFPLKGRACTKDHEEYCSDKVSTTFKPSTTIKNNIVPENNEGPILLIAGLGVGGLFVVLIIVVALVLWRKNTTQKQKKAATYKVDENLVYGTYSRGSMEDGEYGDGDVVEVVDANDYYG